MYIKAVFLSNDCRYDCSLRQVLYDKIHDRETHERQYIHENAHNHKQTLSGHSQ